ncbi:MAG: 50S ribosome-binding GTPase [Nitrospiraceae bacterium]|nr:MAG: 50S ribosome-binding GTPase [Nitrospiraceae bacterium]
MLAVKKKEDETIGGPSCCGQSFDTVTEGLKKIAIVGNPNVGKSVLFNNLTKHYVTVSNYPGTSVEVSRGTVRIEDDEYEVIDTPGIYSLTPLTEEEKVARRILLQEELTLVIHVIDAKNLERMLPFTLQLIETHLPVMLVLNMMDEAGKTGVEINMDLLEKELGLPVVGTISTTGMGMAKLKRRISEYEHKQ